MGNFISSKPKIQEIEHHQRQDKIEQLYQEHQLLIQQLEQLIEQEHSLQQPLQIIQNNFITKIIKLYDIKFRIIEVPNIIYTTLIKAKEEFPNFSMKKASTYIKIVLQNGKIPDDLYNRLVLAACDKNTEPSSTFYEESQIVLSNVFPEFERADLEYIFKENKEMLINTIDFLKDRQTNENSETTNIININDPLVSVQLDEIYSKQEKERKKKEKEIEEKIQMKQAEIHGTLIECTCCICKYPPEWMIKCPNGHLMCKKCVEHQIETLVSEGRSDLKCLKFGGDCDCEIRMEELERLIPERTIERLIQTETLNAITAASLENTVKCHNCGNIVIFEDNENDNPMICPTCKAQTCPKCGEACHKGMTCEQFKGLDKERFIEEKMSDAVVRTCPNCKTPFMKEEGCNKMECPRCKTCICYWCRLVIPKDSGYSHFWCKMGPCPPDRCPLWVENDTLHKAEAANVKNQVK